LAILILVTMSGARSRFEEVVEDEPPRSKPLQSKHPKQAREQVVKSSAKADDKHKPEGAAKSQALKRPRESMEADTPTDKKLTKAEKRKAKKVKAEGDTAAVQAGTAAAGAPKAEKEHEKQNTPAKGEKSTSKPAKALVQLPDGVKYTDSKVGTGPQAKSGNTVSMRYIGKLANGKIFDKNTKGKPVRICIPKFSKRH
jgi:FK506-binding nuclear protein